MLGLILTMATMIHAKPQTSDLKLWYKTPAADWNAALPVGNGRLGAMVFGGVGSERIQLNENTLWGGHRQETVNPKAADALPEVRRLLFAGKVKEATTLAEKTMLGIPSGVASYQTLGDLHLELDETGAVSDYRRELDLETGIAATRFRQNGAQHSRYILASVPDNAIVIAMTSTALEKLAFRVRLTRPQDATTTADGDTLTMTGQISDVPDGKGMKFRAQVKVVTDGKIEIENNELHIRNANGALLLVAAGTDFRDHDPEKLCREGLKAASDTFGNIVDRHVEEHQKLFRRVSLDLGTSPNADLPIDERLEAVKKGANDPALAALYFQFGRYLLMSSSRLGNLPANLQGLWNEHIKAPWGSDYHTNINVQMNYWGAETTNLSECHIPLLDFMETLVPSGRKTAKAHYNARGWIVHHLTDVWGYTTPADGIWGVWLMGAAWLAQHPWEHYQFTQDKEFLAKHGYPVMKEAAEFFLDFLVPEPKHGWLVTNPSHSPENQYRMPDGTVSMFTYGATMDLEIIEDLFSHCLAASEVLQVDADFRARLSDALKRLPPLQISPKTGRLQEWLEDYDDPEPGHRHLSHLFALHPGNQITLRGTPELAAAVRKSLEYRLSHGGGHTGWSRAWIVNFFARLEDGEKAHEHLTALLAKSTLPNLFDNHPPFQIDGNFGGSAGIAEMLLQSHAGEVSLLPALPKAWQNGTASGLRARGGYTASLTWQAGTLQQASIKADHDGTLRIRTKTPVTISGRERVIQIEPTVYQIKVKAGRTYQFAAK